MTDDRKPAAMGREHAAKLLGYGIRLCLALLLVGLAFRYGVQP